MFDVSTGLEFARRLKHELKMTSTSEELFESFLNSINNKSLYMDRSELAAKTQRSSEEPQLSPRVIFPPVN